MMSTKEILTYLPIPRLIPLEYCTLKRAAKMLKIEVDDIKHFNEAGYIPLYFRLEESAISDYQSGEQSTEVSDDFIVRNFLSYRFIPGFVHEIAPIKSDRLSEEMYIKGPDMKTIYDAIYHNKPLFKIPDNEREPNRPLTSRVDKPPVNMIAALLELLPELKQKLDKTPTNAPDILDQHLKVNKLAPLNLGNNNYTNWMSKSDYKPEIKAK